MIYPFKLPISLYDNLSNYSKDNQICPWRFFEEFLETEKNIYFAVSEVLRWQVIYEHLSDKSYL